MSTVRCKVTCPSKATVAGVASGGEVELDPDKVNIRALVKAGFVKTLPDKAPEKPAVKTADKK